jgi:hypothetical protein
LTNVNLQETAMARVQLALKPGYSADEGVDSIYTVLEDSVSFGVASPKADADDPLCCTSPPEAQARCC